MSDSSEETSCRPFDVIKKNLNSNVRGLAKVTTPQTQNPWGVVVQEHRCSKDKTFWAANNGSNFLIQYSLCGQPLHLVNVTGQAPTGLVVNHCRREFQGFQLITATENGTIEGFNNNINPNNTIIIVTTPNAVYKGLTIGKRKLYVCNFNSGNVEVYDDNFNLLLVFTDPALVNSGYAPFNIVSHGKRLYVAFAMQDEPKHDDVPGDGFGYIDVFDLSGFFLHRLINREPLNAPWAMLFSECGKFLYVGNFGDGRINVFCAKTGVFLRPLHDKHGNILVLDGLWGLAHSDKGILFASGIDAEANGLIGLLKSD